MLESFKLNDSDNYKFNHPLNYRIELEAITLYHRL